MMKDVVRATLTRHVGTAKISGKIGAKNTIVRPMNVDARKRRENLQRKSRSDFAGPSVGLF